MESVTYQCECIDENDNSKEEIEDLLYGLGAVVKNEEEALQLLSSTNTVESGVVHGARLKGHMPD